MLARLRKQVIEALPLSPREKEVAELVASGHSNPEIATLLNICLDTVKFHNKKIFDKLGIESRNALIAKIDDQALNRVVAYHSVD